MKCSIYKIGRVFFVLLILGIAFKTTEAKTEYTKTFSKTYAMASDGKVNIENRHGHVNVITWDRNEVHIVVTVRVDARNEGDADDVFDRIKIDFSGDNRYVSARTSIDDKKSTWWFIKSWWDDDDVEIDYEVSMPTTAKLELSHKYGNADLENFAGNVTVNLKYGDLKIDEVGGDLQLDCSYGNATIAKANHTIADVSYFKLRINDANEVNIESKYSQIYIESANQIISQSGYDGYHLGDIGKMTNEGKYDNIQVDKIDELEIITKYTKVSLEYLLHEFRGEMSYGGLEIDRLDPQFARIEVESRYTGLEIDTDDVPAFQLDLEGKYLSYKEPSNLSVSKDQRESNEIYIVGHRGAKNEGGIIKVRGEYGGLKMR
jgi:hypothetical protein